MSSDEVQLKTNSNIGKLCTLYSFLILIVLIVGVIKGFSITNKKGKIIAYLYPLYLLAAILLAFMGN
jgi:hypothetical protein